MYEMHKNVVKYNQNIKLNKTISKFTSFKFHSLCGYNFGRKFKAFINNKTFETCYFFNNSVIYL